jgi:septal ring factor EnvC (AmiA/AmiB activator)
MAQSSSDTPLVDLSTLFAEIGAAQTVFNLWALSAQVLTHVAAHSQTSAGHLGKIVDTLSNASQVVLPQINQHAQQIKDLETRLDTATATIGEHTKEFGTQTSRFDDLTTQITNVETELGTSRQTLRHAGEHIQRLQQEQETMAERLTEIRGELIALIERECREPCRQLHTDRVELSRRIEALEKIGQHASPGTSEGAEHPPGRGRQR